MVEVDVVQIVVMGKCPEPTAHVFAKELLGQLHSLVLCNPLFLFMGTT